MMLCSMAVPEKWGVSPLWSSVATTASSSDEVEIHTEVDFQGTYVQMQMGRSTRTMRLKVIFNN